MLSLLVVPYLSAGNVVTNYRMALVLTYDGTSSTYEDDNIKLEIYDESLWATNKTSQTLYLDLSQCFVYHNEASMPMFNQDGRKESSKKGYTDVDEFLTIAPSAGKKAKPTCVCGLSFGFYGEYSTSETPSGRDFTEYDMRFLTLIGDVVEESGVMNSNGKKNPKTVHRHLTEDESIVNIGISIAYAFNKRSEDWTTVSIASWISDVIFAPYYVEMPHELKGKEKRGFGVKEQDPVLLHVRAEYPFEYDEEKSGLVVADWDGDYKKGTFTLTSTRISKTKGKTAAILGSLLVGPAALALITEENYKSKIVFEEEEGYWGEMKYQNSYNPSKMKQFIDEDY